MQVPRSLPTVHCMNQQHKPIRRPSWPCTLVTGASSGLGWELALQLARSGTTVVALARDIHRLETLAWIAGPGTWIVPWPADLSRTETLPSLARSLLAAHPDLGCVIHNAGVQHDRLLADADYAPEAIGQELAVNLTAPVLLTQALLPHLMRRADACVVNVCSSLVYAPKRQAAVYAASKAGLSMFTRAMRLQLAGSPVRMVDVVPPLVDTPMTAGRSQRKMSSEAAARALIAGVEAGQNTIHIGAARALPWLARLGPGLLARVMAR